jgi:hypothetical protein
LGETLAHLQHLSALVLHFADSKRFTGDVVAPLISCTNLQRLQLNSVGSSDQPVYLEDLPDSLQDLSITYGTCDSYGVLMSSDDSELRFLKGLTSLEITFQVVGNISSKATSALIGLRHLHMKSLLPPGGFPPAEELCAEVSLSMGEAIGQLVQLTSLELGADFNGEASWMSGGVATVLSNLPQLQQLSLTFVGNAEQPVQLADLPRSLQGFTLWACTISSTGLDTVTGSSSSSSSDSWQLSGVEKLVVMCRDGSGSAALPHPAALPSMSQLQHLVITASYSKPDEVTFKDLLSMLPELQQLQHLTPAGFVEQEGAPEAAAAYYAALTASRHLTELELLTCKLPPAIVQHMFPAGRLLPRLKKLKLSCYEGPGDPGLELESAEDVRALVACCPAVEAAETLVIRAEVDLQPLLQLSALTALRLMGDGCTIRWLSTYWCS